MNSEIYRDLYNFEMEQRGHLIDAVNVPIIAITVLGSALATMLLSFPYQPGMLQLGFAVFSGVAGAGLVVAITAVFRSFIGYEYERPASPHIWQAHFDKLLVHYVGKADANALADAAFQRAFNSRLADATDTNRSNNRKRGNSIVLANICCAATLAALAAAGACFVIASIQQGALIHEVRIVP
jgi:hypothetical protein